MTATEVVKKRGRPKKVVEEVSAVEEAKVKGTRNASTKAAPAPKASTSSANIRAAKPAPKPAAKMTKTIPPKPVPFKSIPSKTSSDPKKPIVSSPPTISRPPTSTKPTPVTPETSKILQKVAQARADPSRPPQPTQPSSTSRPAPPKPTATPAPPPPRPTPISIRGQPSHPQPRAAPPYTYPSSKLPDIPPHSSNPSHPATANFKGQMEANKYVMTGKVNPKYKAAGRRITTIIVGIPIILVVGWELYQRLFMGKEMKKFYREGEGRPV